MAKTGFTKLNPSKTLFLLCDVQEKFRKAIPLFDNMVKNITKLMKVRKAFNIPLIVTEQYPRGIGNTVKELDIREALAVVPKTKFSMYLPEVLGYINECVPNNPEDLVLFGLETHVCVLQSSVDFLANDYRVHIVADCCASRLNQDRDIALALMRQIGCFVQTSESVSFSLTRDKDNPKFQSVRKAVSDTSADMQLANAHTKSYKKRPEKRILEKKTVSENHSKKTSDKNSIDANKPEKIEKK